MSLITPVILAGGSGTRLWPASRTLMPKQFLKLYGEHSLLQETIKRLSSLDHNVPMLLCNEEHRFLVAEEIRISGVKGASIILEPIAKNTAPAIALAAFLSKPEEILLVLAADHIIKDDKVFEEAVVQALPYAQQGNLMTFGVVPTEPHTGYGYVKATDKNGVSAVQKFVEKPNAQKAAEYFKDGSYFWNSGMFMFQAGAYLNELQKSRPDIFEAVNKSIENLNQDQDFIRPDLQSFVTCASESIDYAVMEHTQNAYVTPLQTGWSDVGSWTSLWDILEKDCLGNATRGNTLIHSTQNSLVFAENRLVATVGLKDMVVVDTKDAVLVAAKEHIQDVKAVVNLLNERDSKECMHGREVYRPWGKYDSVDMGIRDQVKRITVKPGAKLSLQMHHHRAEHWVVVSGTARVTRGDDIVLVCENESVYIPIGEKHSLENPGKIPLEIIEVQTGAYLGEDDIVRIKDIYGRLEK